MRQTATEVALSEPFFFFVALYALNSKRGSPYPTVVFFCLIRVMYFKKTILQKSMFAKSYHTINVCIFSSNITASSCK